MDKGFEVIPHSQGISVSDSSHDLLITNGNLYRVSVDSCLFRMYGRCSHCNDSTKSSDLSDTCPEMVKLFLSLSEDTKSFSEVLEKYHIFVGELQASEDFKEFRQLDQQVKELESQGLSGPDLEKLEMKRTAMRLWQLDRDWETKI